MQGQTIGGYRIEDEIARGGTAVVFLARHPTLDRRVALKVLREDRQSAVTAARLRAEAEILARLDHPHIVRVENVGEDGGRPWLVMEHVAGGTLQDRVDAGATEPREAATILRDVARGLDHAHRLSVLHRDLKPANILLAEDGRPVIIDFGLGGKRDGFASGSGSSSIEGTPRYMAPEQVNRNLAPIGPRSDVYGLGGVLYALLTGRPPIIEDSTTATLDAVVNRDPVRPRKLQRGIPRALETVCLTCLEKDPDRRYATAEALAEDLERVLADEPILARPPGIVERLARARRRRPVAAAVLVTLGLILTLALGAAGAGALRRRQQRLAAIAAVEPARRAASRAVTEARASKMRELGDELRLIRLELEALGPADRLTSAVAEDPALAALGRRLGDSGKSLKEAESLERTLREVWDDAVRTELGRVGSVTAVLRVLPAKPRAQLAAPGDLSLDPAELQRLRGELAWCHMHLYALGGETPEAGETAPPVTRQDRAKRFRELRAGVIGADPEGPRGRAATLLSARAALDERRFREARALLVRLTSGARTDPLTVAARAEMARVFFADRDTDQALAWIRRARADFEQAARSGDSEALISRSRLDWICQAFEAFRTTSRIKLPGHSAGHHLPGAVAFRRDGGRPQILVPRESASPSGPREELEVMDLVVEEGRLQFRARCRISAPVSSSRRVFELRPLNGVRRWVLAGQREDGQSELVLFEVRDGIWRQVGRPVRSRIRDRDFQPRDACDLHGDGTIHIGTSLSKGNSFAVYRADFTSGRPITGAPLLETPSPRIGTQLYGMTFADLDGDGLRDEVVMTIAEWDLFSVFVAQLEDDGRPRRFSGGSVFHRHKVGIPRYPCVRRLRGADRDEIVFRLLRASHMSVRAVLGWDRRSEFTDGLWRLVWRGGRTHVSPLRRFPWELRDELMVSGTVSPDPRLPGFEGAAAIEVNDNTSGTRLEILPPPEGPALPVLVQALPRHLWRHKDQYGHSDLDGDGDAELLRAGLFGEQQELSIEVIGLKPTGGPIELQKQDATFAGRVDAVLGPARRQLASGSPGRARERLLAKLESLPRGSERRRAALRLVAQAWQSEKNWENARLALLRICRENPDCSTEERLEAAEMALLADDGAAARQDLEVLAQGPPPGRGHEHRLRRLRDEVRARAELSPILSWRPGDWSGLPGRAAPALVRSPWCLELRSDGARRTGHLRLLGRRPIGLSRELDWRGGPLRLKVRLRIQRILSYTAFNIGLRRLSEGYEPDHLQVAIVTGGGGDSMAVRRGVRLKQQFFGPLGRHTLNDESSLLALDGFHRDQDITIDWELRPAGGRSRLTVTTGPIPGRPSSSRTLSQSRYLLVPIAPGRYRLELGFNSVDAKFGVEGLNEPTIPRLCHAEIDELKLEARPGRVRLVSDPETRLRARHAFALLTGRADSATILRDARRASPEVARRLRVMAMVDRLRDRDSEALEAILAELLNDPEPVEIRRLLTEVLVASGEPARPVLLQALSSVVTKRKDTPPLLTRSLRFGYEALDSVFIAFVSPRRAAFEEARYVAYRQVGLDRLALDEAGRHPDRRAGHRLRGLLLHDAQRYAEAARALQDAGLNADDRLPPGSGLELHPDVVTLRRCLLLSGPSLDAPEGR